MKKNQLARIDADEATFYAIANKAWAACSEGQKVFIAFNSTYTPEYIAQQIRDIKAAKDLPNKEARLAVQSRMRVILESKASVCNNLVQNLYTIIARFPVKEIESLRQEAGSAYYTKAASGENRNDADTLYTMVAAFLITYGDDLLNHNMPANFPDSFAEAQAAFNDANSKYSEVRDNVTKGTNAKSEANAAAHTSLMSMLADGKAIYRKEPATAKFFVYSHLKIMVAGPGKTGIRFSLKQDITKLPVANAFITVQPGNYTLYPNAKGVAEQLLGAGNYTYTITAPGDITVIGNIKVKAGSVKRANIIFTKAEAGKPVETTVENNSSDISEKVS